MYSRYKLNKKKTKKIPEITQAEQTEIGGEKVTECIVTKKTNKQ